MRYWAIPSFSGDFRFESKDEGKSCSLVVEKPTAAEAEALSRWSKKALKAGWLKEAQAEMLNQGGSQELYLAGVPLTDAAAEMAKLLHYKRAGVITAFAFADGTVKVTEALGADQLPKWAKGKLDAVYDPVAGKSKYDAEEEAPAVVVPPETPPAAVIAKAAKPEKAVTVSRPSLSCPECPGPKSNEPRNMACEVLWEFLTPEEREEWLSDRAITVFGGLTGHCYRIAARDTKEAASRGRPVFDLDDRVILHNYHLTVPPEEEVLTNKLLLEHRENWLRVHGEVDPIHRARQIFTSPWPFRP